MPPSPAVPNDLQAASRALRRLPAELVVLVLAKIALLTLIWWVAIAPHPRPDTSPAAVAHLLSPASPSHPQEARP